MLISYQRVYTSECRTCHVGHQPFACEKGPKSHKNGNPRMPILTGCAYFYDTGNLGISGTLVLMQTIDIFSNF